MKRIGIIMTYFNRPYQLKQTLRMIARTKYQNYFVIVIDDNSNSEPDYQFVPCDVTYLRLTKKQWTNPEPVYNIGLKFALGQSPDIIILQNAECYHIGDILTFASNITDSEYYSFSCFSLSRESTFNGCDIDKLIIGKHGANKDGQDAWYNHPIYRPVGYDFCSAITVSNIKLLNGYDERFSNGCGYGDDYLLARIRMLGLNIQIIEYPFVAHQWHYDCSVPENKSELVERNRVLFNQLSAGSDYRAVHLLTSNL